MDRSIDPEDHYVARHVAATGKNWWQVALVVGVAIGAFASMKLSGAKRTPISPIWRRALRNFIMLKVFLTAVATGAVVLAVLNGFGYVKLQPKAAVYAADIVGGLLLGAGISLSGACPGTTLAQIGTGYRDALFTLVGGLFGAVTYSYAQPALAKTLLSQSGPKLIFSDLVGVPYWIGALVLAGVIGVMLVGLEEWSPWHGELGNDVDGDLPAAPSPRMRAQPAE